MTAAHRADEPLGGENDLYGLAQTVARSPADWSASRTSGPSCWPTRPPTVRPTSCGCCPSSGREGPADYLRRLRERGVYDRLRRERGPCRGAGRRRARLAPPAGGGHPTARSERTGVRDASARHDLDPGGRPAARPGRESVLEGAAAIAARLIERARSAPTQEALQIQRLLGLRGGGVDIPSLAAALSLPPRRAGGGGRDRGRTPTARAWSGAVRSPTSPRRYGCTPARTRASRW